MIDILSLLVVSWIGWCNAELIDDWENEFDYHTFVGGSENRYEIYWNSHNENCMLEVGLAVQTDGWVGFGISLSGAGMSNADIVIGYFDDNNKMVLQNRIGFGKTTPALFEDQSHIEAIEGEQSEINGTMWTFIRFKREMFPDFDDNAVSIKLGTTKVIWAYRDGPVSNEIQYHGRCLEGNGCRGTESINLLQGESPEIELEADIDYTDVYFPDVQVPGTDTTYYCSLLELPRFEKKQHVVRIDPLIEEKNLGVVHHMLLYICPEHLVNTSYVGTGSPCDDLNENMPGLFCRGGMTLYAWAIGGKNFYLPEGVGIEIGGNDDDAIQYLLLETHYDNPELDDSIVDSSGLRLWYTPSLREMSAGIIAVGMDPWFGGQWIPGGLEHVVNYGYCYTECLEPGIEGTGINGNSDRVYVFANFLHAHLLGKELILRHIRDGQELRPLDMNLAYDFDYQQMVPLEKYVEIFPGDQLVLECVYNSSGKSEMTFGGEATYNEMCLSFLMVYPKPKLTSCTTTYSGHYNWSSQTFDGGDVYQFFSEAEEAGYYDANTTIYDVTVPGALEFYNDFASGHIFTDDPSVGAVRYQNCLDSSYNLIITDDEAIIPAIRPEIEFTTFDDEDYYICTEKDDDESGFDWNGWYVYFVASLIGVLIIASIVCVVMKFKSPRHKSNSTYHRVLGTHQTNYGSNQQTNQQQISMQDRV